MNKYEINHLLIHVKEQEQTLRAYYAVVVVVVLSMKNAIPYFEWNRLLVTGKFFSRNQMKSRQEKCRFLAWFGEFKVSFCKIVDV